MHHVLYVYLNVFVSSYDERCFEDVEGRIELNRVGYITTKGEEDMTDEV